MSAGPATVSVAPRFARAPPPRPSELSEPTVWAIRGVTFAALAAYGILRWATLIRPAPTGRLLGLGVLAMVLVAVVTGLRRYGWPAAVVAAAVLCLLALPIAGLPWADFIHLRIAVSAREIERGLSGLPGSYVPHTGSGHAVPLVIVLGAGVLLLDAAIVLGSSPRELGDGRRAGAALPLIALAIVPSTLLRPEFPYLQGLLLFALLVAFLWGERARRQGAAPTLVLIVLAGIGGGLLAPRLDSHRAWISYRSWTGTLAQGHLDAFDWNQSYGPLRWPRAGHIVMNVTAERADYWKAQNLDVFNGRDWVAGRVAAQTLPVPDQSAVNRWSQIIRVQDTGMRSSDVIAAGYAASNPLLGTATPGDSPGTWVANPPLTPGTTYTVATYSPHPSATELANAGGDYPEAALAPYRTIALPDTGTRAVFAPFRPALADGSTAAKAVRLVNSSPYAPVYALARRLAAHAATPYAYARSIRTFLSQGYAYNESPPVRRYPLVSFLFKDKLGYCQQFSGAMALLLRMGGVPARVAAGFTSGDRGAGGGWVVSDIDAHAWVEAWFPHYGWVRFDPTPATAPARGGRSDVNLVKALPGSTTAGPNAAKLHPQTQTTPAAGAHSHATGSAATDWLLLPAAAVAIVVLALLIGLLRPEPSAEDRLLELERALARSGGPMGPDVTLAALERRFSDSRSAAGYIRALRLIRYAGADVTPDARGRRAVREQLWRGRGVAGRLRALWALPPRLGRGTNRRLRGSGPAGQAAP